MLPLMPLTIDMNIKKRWAGIVTIILYAALLIVVYIFQSMIFPFMRIAGLVPLILPIVSTGIAVSRGRMAGGVSGLFAGMLTDLSFNQPLALFTVILTLAGVGVGAMADTVIAKRFGTYFLSCVAVLAFCAIVQLSPLLIFGAAPILTLFNTALWEIVYSLVFTIPIWLAIRRIVSISEES
jgi:cell shape-determining protein MreD